MSWAHKSHRGKPSFHKQEKKVFKKPADPWLYMGEGLYMKVSEFNERYKNKRRNNNAS